MKEQFIPYEQALELKELGFNEPCIGHWERGIDGYGWGLFFSGQWLKYEDLIPEYKDSEGNICGEFSAPFWQQAFDWFSNKYGIQVFPDYTFYDGFYYSYKWAKPNGETGWFSCTNDNLPDGFTDFKEARLDCLKELIKLYK